jgi:hypothetical protein
MKIYIKSRGNLRKQDYIYWLDENSSPQSPKILDNLALLDDRNPGILLLYQDGYYHLLVSSLDSDRKEPSSPSLIRNFIFFTEIEEEEAKFLTIYALQHWKQLAKDVTTAIQADDSVYGYKFDCDRLKVIDRLVSNTSENLSPSYIIKPRRKLTEYSDVYGEVGGNEWKNLADKLDIYSLPEKEKSIIILVTKYQPCSDNRHLFILLSDESRRNNSISHDKCNVSHLFRKAERSLGSLKKNAKEFKNKAAIFLDDLRSDLTNSTKNENDDDI